MPENEIQPQPIFNISSTATIKHVEIQNKMQHQIDSGVPDFT